MTTVAGILRRRVCHRCKGPLSLDLNGVPHCFNCRRRDHKQIAAMVTHGTEQANRAHALLNAAATEESQ